MESYFNHLNPVTKDRFIELCDHHANSRDEKDDFEFEVLNQIKATANLNFYNCHLNEKGISNLILPHNDREHESGRHPDRPVKDGGESFSKVINDYIENYIPNDRFPASWQKAQGQKARFFKPDDGILKADFLFVSNNKELAHKNHYDTTHGENKIYMGNGFHRFVAYGLWINEHGFKPLEVYYVEEPT